MITLSIHLASLLIGVILGSVIGIAIAYYSVWKVEQDMGSPFNNGWDAGYKYGVEVGKGNVDMLENSKE